MPAQEVAFLLEKAVVWEAAGVDRSNEPVVLTPYEIDVRWDATSSKGIDQTGQPVRYDASIDTKEDYPLGSIFWLGNIDEIASPPVDLFRAVSKQETKDLRGVSIQRTYNLLRFHNTLPTIVGTG